LIPALLVGMLIIGFSKPVTGQLGPPKLSVDPSSITTNISTEFSIDILITDIPENNRMEGVYIRAAWLRAAMDRVGEKTNQPAGWGVASLVAPMSMPLPPEDWISFDFSMDGTYVTEDRRWVTITFHCAGAGITTILVEGTADMSTVGAGPQTFELEPIEITVNQIDARPVGGLVMPTNKLEILTPYLALAGLIVAVSAVVAVKKRRE
jgi:hypothetical protein